MPKHESILRKGKKWYFARDLAISLCREMTGETGVALGRHFGGISGAGIAFKYNQIVNQIRIDHNLKGRGNRIRKKKLNI